MNFDNFRKVIDAMGYVKNVAGMENMTEDQRAIAINVLDGAISWINDLKNDLRGGADD